MIRRKRWPIFVRGSGPGRSIVTESNDFIAGNRLIFCSFLMSRRRVLVQCVHGQTKTVSQKSSVFGVSTIFERAKRRGTSVMLVHGCIVSFSSSLASPCVPSSYFKLSPAALCRSIVSSSSSSSRLSVCIPSHSCSSSVFWHFLYLICASKFILRMYI